MYDTDEFSEDIERYLSSLDDEEFDDLLKDISKEISPEQDEKIIKRMIREGNWWDSLMDVDSRDVDE